MLEALGVSSSFLTYHIENLGELVGKAEDGKYRLSSFGEAANAMMNKVEDIPTIASHISQMPMPKTNWFRARSAVVALGIICILLIAGLGGTIAYYAIATNSKQNELNSMDNTISSLNYQISQLNSTVTNLQKQIASDNSTIDSLKSLVANLLPPDTAEGVNEQLGLQLTMTLQKTNYSLGEPVNMNFTITNISNQTISLFQYGVGAFDMFEFQVYNDTNNSVWSLIYPVFPIVNPGGPVVTTTRLYSEESLTGVLVWEQMCNDTVPVPVSPGTYCIVGQIGPIFMNGTIETTPIQIVIA